MADRKPLKVLPDGGGDSTGLGEFVAADTIGVVDGGTGLATVGSNQLLTGNGTSALTSESNLTFDGSTLAVTGSMTLSSTSTISGDMTFVDNAKVTLGTGGDADIYYDGSNLVVTPDVVGNGSMLVDSDEQVISEFTTSGSSAFIVVSCDTETVNDAANIAFNASKDATVGSANTTAYIAGTVTQAHASALKGDLRFFTNSGDNIAERMRIASDGKTAIGYTGTLNQFFSVEGAVDNNYALLFKNSSSTNPQGMLLTMGGSPDDNTYALATFNDSTAQRCVIWSDGDLANHDGVYGTLSDVKLKQDITDTRSYWDDFRALQYRKYRHKTDVEADPDAPYRLGLIAQEVESVFPALVPESPDPDITESVAVLDEDGNAVLDEEGNPTFEEVTTPSGTTHKWIKSSIIEGPIMASVVQELQTRLEAAEAKIAALEAA